MHSLYATNYVVMIKEERKNAIPQGMLDSFTEETLKISVLPNS